jgi:hypothetical protein
MVLMENQSDNLCPDIVGHRIKKNHNLVKGRKQCTVKPTYAIKILILIIATGCGMNDQWSTFESP